MKHEIIELNDVQIIGMSREITFNNPSECPRFWGEYVERIVKPVYLEGKEPDEFQKAAVENGVGEFGLCTCDIPGHNCGNCGAVNFTACNTKTFTYVIGGRYKGGKVPDGMKLYPLRSGKWLKVHFEGGMAAFQQQFKAFHDEWLPQYPDFKAAPDAQFLEWYCGTDINSPDYQCGVMMAVE